MRTLDSSREHTTIYGDSAARFYQDGMYFDAEGKQVSADAAAQRNPGGPVLPVAAVLEPAPPMGDPPPAPTPPPMVEATIQVTPESEPVTIEVPVVTDVVETPEVTNETTFGTDANGSPVEG